MARTCAGNVPTGDTERSMARSRSISSGVGICDGRFDNSRRATGSSGKCRKAPRCLWIRGLIVVGFFLVYQQFENHVLQPMVYGRTVQLSPLAVLIAVLVGAELAGVIGALGAIPLAGTLQVVLLDWLAHRRARLVATPTGVDT